MYSLTPVSLSNSQFPTDIHPHQNNSPPQHSPLLAVMVTKSKCHMFDITLIPFASSSLRLTDARETRSLVLLLPNGEEPAASSGSRRWGAIDLYNINDQWNWWLSWGVIFCAISIYANNFLQNSIMSQSGIFPLLLFEEDLLCCLYLKNRGVFFLRFWSRSFSQNPVLVNHCQTSRKLI